MTYEDILNQPHIQEWLTYLKENPEKQIKSVLGVIKDVDNPTLSDIERACCLGVACAIYSLEFNLPFSERCMIISNSNNKTNNSEHYLVRDQWEYFYLQSEKGSFDDEDEYFPIWDEMNEFFYNIGKDIPTEMSLAGMNDNKFSWLEIAEFIEAFPQLVFKLPD